MKFKLTLLLLCVYAMGYSQPVNRSYKENIPPPPPPVQPSVLRTAATEICNNLLDDDNNGLIDEKILPVILTGSTQPAYEIISLLICSLYR